MKKSADTDSQGAIALLKADHREVEDAFEQYKKLADGDYTKKKQLADHICDELTVHMTVEEEIFYPTVKSEVNDADDIVNEGIVEHAGAKVLIKEIKAMKGDEELFDTKVNVLAEQIEHHVKEEEEDMFPKVQKSKVDLLALGKEIEQRKSGLR
ncbi:MAG: hemerythrin domain-containing protein [Pseudohongiella sp.]|nr:hemerythrin domain-containing protein [Pseudohongiella sp.]MDO9520632.1 hemerythrin domain-containing protein [Pseudohongiella sp.]MDP2127902.1 hemerythrin domain-containing protein [Pseudohongiella sp.]